VRLTLRGAEAEQKRGPELHAGASLPPGAIFDPIKLMKMSLMFLNEWIGAEKY